MWRVEVVTPAVEGDERDRTEVITVTVASHARPEPGPFGQPVVFEGLLVSPGYLSRKTGQLTPPRWTAEGVRGQSRKQDAA
ncbi:hypothetical protein [Pseudonocardia sp. ICBG601]|uniref:hypothetical protein n=1 Tax=Pseudonocardia sp. ICBG601 TaxID=2846759 RepID=UPI001CF6ABBE|nr:hypothetical protein [Pseudonocardia sp. ICBG601]